MLPQEGKCEVEHAVTREQEQGQKQGWAPGAVSEHTQLEVPSQVRGGLLP